MLRLFVRNLKPLHTCTWYFRLYVAEACSPSGTCRGLVWRRLCECQTWGDPEARPECHPPSLALGLWGINTYQGKMILGYSKEYYILPWEDLGYCLMEGAKGVPGNEMGGRSQPEHAILIHFLLDLPLFYCVHYLPTHVSLTRCSSASLRADRTRRQPARARSYARYSPIPLDAPTSQTTSPFSTAGWIGYRICDYNIDHRMLIEKITKLAVNFAKHHWLL